MGRTVPLFQHVCRCERFSIFSVESPSIRVPNVQRNLLEALPAAAPRAPVEPIHPSMGPTVSICSGNSGLTAAADALTASYGGLGNKGRICKVLPFVSISVF